MASPALLIGLKGTIRCWVSTGRRYMKANSLPAIDCAAAAGARRTHMFRDRVQGPDIMADLAVADQLGIGRIPARIIGIIGVTLPALGGHVPLESHMMGIKVADNILVILIVPDVLAPLIIMVKSRGMTSITVRADAGIKTRDCVHRSLIPMAVLAGERGGSHDRIRIFRETGKRCNLCHHISIMAGHTVLRLRKVGIVVPAIGIHINPVVAATRCTIPDYDHAGWIRYDLMTRRTHFVS